MDPLGKRILHSVCGAMAGGCLGILIWAQCLRVVADEDSFIWFVLAGGIVGAVIAFYLTDGFWEKFR